MKFTQNARNNKLKLKKKQFNNNSTKKSAQPPKLNVSKLTTSKLHKFCLFYFSLFRVECFSENLNTKRKKQNFKKKSRHPMNFSAD